MDPDTGNPQPVNKKSRRGQRSWLASLRRRMIQAIRHKGLEKLVEVALLHGMLLLRPIKGAPITYGYPSGKRRPGQHPKDYAAPSSVKTPEEHVEWIKTNNLTPCAAISLPTMLQATAAIQEELSTSEINRVRESNMRALRAWVAEGSSPSVYPTKANPSAPHWNLHHIRALMEITNHVDEDIIQHLSTGFPITGTISSGGLFPPLKKPRHAKVAPDDLVADKKTLKKVEDYLSKTGKEDSLVAAVEEDVTSETEMGRALGPYHINSYPDLIKFASPLFGIDQGDKVRIISNYSFKVGGKTFNEATTTLHKVQMPRLAHVACLIAELQPTTSPLQLARIDHQSAFRQLPILPKDSERAAGMYRTACGDTMITVPLVCPFGAIGSISAYLRISEFHCHLLRCLGLCNFFAYMDDFFPVEKQEAIETAMQFFYLINDITGAKIKHSKTIRPAGENDLLGLRVSLQNGTCEVSLTPTRKERLLRDLALARDKQECVDSKFAGRLNFACEALFGRLGRAPARLITRKSMGLRVDHSLIRDALSLLLQLFTAASYKRNLLSEVPLLEASPYVCYADASTSYGIGIHAPAQVSMPTLQGSLKLQNCQEHINLLELLATASALESFRFWIGNRPVLLFTDNTTCESLILRGSSSSTTLARAVADFWLRLYELNIFQVFIAHVPSALNPADLPSRGPIGLHPVVDLIPVTVKLPPWWTTLQRTQL